jgi:UDP-N-acetylglucosamine:LPS N-acetylglucosamine transferase
MDRMAETMTLRWNGRSNPRSPRRKLLFFTRGRGRGHAVPDLAIVGHLETLAPHVDVKFVSYGTGAATLVQEGRAVIDLGLREDCDYLDLLVRSGRVLEAERPDVVVSHEDFAVLPAAKVFGLPTVLVVDFFLPVEHLWMQSLVHADRVVFIENRGVFPEPATTRGKVRYVGPVRRPLSYGRADKSRARRALHLPEDGIVVSVIPGAWATEARAPLLDLLVPAFDALPYADKRLVWLAGHDHEAVSERLQRDERAVILREYSPVEAVMAASDLVITKGNRGSTLEVAALGVPSVSVSYGTNPIDEAVLPRIRSNVALHARAIDAAFLADVVRGALAHSSEDRNTCAPGGVPEGPGAIAAAEELLRFVTEKPDPGSALRQGEVRAAQVTA